MRLLSDITQCYDELTSSPVTCHTSSFPHHHHRLSPRAPHPGVGARMLRYQVSYPIFPLIQPHLTPYLSRQNEHDSPTKTTPNARKSRTAAQGKGRGPDEYPCHLIWVNEHHQDHENVVDAPPNAVSPHHLSLGHIDGQQTRTQIRTDIENRENHPNDQNDGQDNPCKANPPRTSPFPSSSDVGVHKAMKT